MKAFDANPQIKSDVLLQLKGGPRSSHQPKISTLRSRQPGANTPASGGSRLQIIAATHLPDEIIRVAADIELSYTTESAREVWMHDFILSITPGANLNDAWRTFFQKRFKLALASKNLQWLSTQQLQIVQSIVRLLEASETGVASWRRALKVTAYAILDLDLNDRRRHGLGPISWHTEASVLQSLVEELPDLKALEILPAIASGTCHLAYGIVDPYWKDSRFHIDTHANILLDVVRTAPM